MSLDWNRQPPPRERLRPRSRWTHSTLGSESVAADSRLERSSPRFTRALTTAVSMDSLDATAQVHRLRLETRATITSTVVSYSLGSSTRVLATSVSMDSLDATVQVQRLSLETRAIVGLLYESADNLGLDRLTRRYGPSPSPPTRDSSDRHLDGRLVLVGILHRSARVSSLEASSLEPRVTSRRFEPRASSLGSRVFGPRASGLASSSLRASGLEPSSLGSRVSGLGS